MSQWPTLHECFYIIHYINQISLELSIQRINFLIWYEKSNIFYQLTYAFFTYIIIRCNAHGGESLQIHKTTSKCPKTSSNIQKKYKLQPKYIHVLAAHIWRTTCKARGLSADQDIKLYKPIDGRPRLKSIPFPSNYNGNVIFFHGYYYKSKSYFMWTFNKFGI